MSINLALCLTVLVYVFRPTIANWRLFDSDTGQVVACNKENPCPQGYLCLSDPKIPGMKSCFYNAVGKAKTPGSCPRPLDSRTQFSNRCSMDSNCNAGQKCCKISRNSYKRACVKPVPISVKPKITILMPGVMNSTANGYFFFCSIILVQSKGKNIIFDTGTVGQRVPFIRQLSELAGLTTEDIDFVITSHGHPDHYSNGVLFTDIPNNFDSYSVVNSDYIANPLSKKQKFFIFGDPNLELIKTPGHTPQDTSLVVRNVPNVGTVLIVGDLVLMENDNGLSGAFSQDKEGFKKSQKVVFCLADVIIPGHGAMFKVTPAQKKLHGCA